VGDLTNVLLSYYSLSKENDSYCIDLENAKKAAQDALRLQEVSDFCTTIGYSSFCQKVNVLRVDKLQAEERTLKIEAEIAVMQKLMHEKRRQLNDEEEGARQINKYLNDYFGYNYLSLRAVKAEKVNARIRFQIFREDKPGFNLSSGERSLIAFCYFMAKLNDADTKLIKPIIWIDDPISNLDSNHILFLYDLILTELVKKDCYSQFFLSTHNLDFMKYWQQINVIETKSTNEKRFFVIKRTGKISTIEQMPNHLKEHIAEYKHLYWQETNEIGAASHEISASV
jgi:wobble nucleotide-excising tRNase